MNEIETRCWNHFTEGDHTFELNYCDSDFGCADRLCKSHNLNFLTPKRDKKISRDDIPSFGVVWENFPPLDFIIYLTSCPLVYFFTHCLETTIRLYAPRGFDETANAPDESDEMNIDTRVCIAMSYAQGTRKCYLIGVRLVNDSLIEKTLSKKRYKYEIHNIAGGKLTKACR